MARILIVDDEASDRLIEETILTEAGHEVLSTADGENALRRCLDNSIDVVITDLEMPDVHGFELISILRDMRPSPPVIAVSGKGDLHLHMARELGASVTLRKPVDKERLLRAVENVLETG